MRQEDEEEWRRVKRALWIAALVVAGVVAAVLVIRTWLTPELPEIDEAAFIEPDVERPQDADNAYLAFVAATNDIAFTYVAADAVPREEWDAVLASNAQAIAKIDAAMRLPAWYNAASRHGEPSIFAVHFGNVRSLFTVRIKREVEMGEIAAVVERHGMRTAAIPFRSTAENLAKLFYGELKARIPGLSAVKVWETADSSAECRE